MDISILGLALLAIIWVLILLACSSPEKYDKLPDPPSRKNDNFNERADSFVKNISKFIDR